MAQGTPLGTPQWPLWEKELHRVDTQWPLWEKELHRVDVCLTDSPRYAPETNEEPLHSN